MKNDVSEVILNKGVRFAPTSPIYSSLDRNDTDKKEKADNHDEREAKTRETPKAKSFALRESRIWGECLIYFAQVFWSCVLRRYNPFVLIESSCM